jgi:hypothetical protein
MVRVGIDATSWIAKLTIAVPADAVSVAVWAVETEAAVAVKLAVAEPARTVTEAGVVTDALLLVKVTAKPPVAAGVFRVTVQMSVPAPVMEAVAQEIAVRTGVPVPVRLIAAGLVLELLATVSWPVAAPAVAGSN